MDIVTKSVKRKPPKGGSRKGIPNRATANAREAIARFVDQGADQALGWLEEVYEREGPLAAFRCWLDLIEYHVPKLARSELTGKDGKELKGLVYLPAKDGQPGR